MTLPALVLLDDSHFQPWPHPTTMTFPALTSPDNKTTAPAAYQRRCTIVGKYTFSLLIFFFYIVRSLSLRRLSIDPSKSQGDNNNPHLQGH